MKRQDLTEAGALAVAEALRLFDLDVYDPPVGFDNEAAKRSRKVIDDVLRAAGWTWEIPYRGDGQVEWCGLFAAACWRAAGIDPKWLATYFASTYRLDTWARYQPFDEKHPNHRPADAVDGNSDSRRRMAILDQNDVSIAFDPRPGDIVMVGDGKPPMGQHITIALSYDAARRAFSTISGNGYGVGPDDRNRQGIVRREFKIGGPGYCVRRVIRPALGDLTSF